MKTMSKTEAGLLKVKRVSEDQVKKHLEQGFNYCPKKVWKEQKNKPIVQNVEEIIE